MQILENALLFTVQHTGKDMSPAGLRKLWQDVARGRDFILPFPGKNRPLK